MSRDVTRRLALPLAAVLCCNGCVTPAMWGWTGRNATHHAAELTELRVGDDKKVTATVRYSCGVRERLVLPGRPIVLVLPGFGAFPTTAARAEAVVHEQAVPRRRALKWAAGAPASKRPLLLGFYGKDPSRLWVATPKHFSDRPTEVHWIERDTWEVFGATWPAIRGCPEHAEETVLLRTLLLPGTVIADTVMVVGITAGAAIGGVFVLAAIALRVGAR